MIGNEKGVKREAYPPLINFCKRKVKVNSSSENDENSWDTSSSGGSEECERKVKSNDVEFVWLSSRRGQIPSGGIRGGKEGNGHMGYIGRAEYKGSLIIAKVKTSHEALYVAFDGKEIKINFYEVLCIKNIFNPNILDLKK